MDHQWVTTCATEDVPLYAIQAGCDTDGDPIYVGRALHNGEAVPAKVIPNKRQAFVPWGGAEHTKHDVEILTGQNYVWMHCSNGNVPPYAVCAGLTNDGEKLFVGRGEWGGSLTVGKIQPSHGCLYIPYGGGEHKLEEYEVLVQPEMWISSTPSSIILGTVHGGNDADGDDIYVGRAYHDGELLPAKIIPNKNSAYVSCSGVEHAKDEVEMLVGCGYSWVPDANGNVPDNAIKCGKTSDGETLYVGRGEWCGSLTPGKIHQSHGCLYIPFGGQEIRLANYEVLVKN